jgi:hypothetical protein
MIHFEISHHYKLELKTGPLYGRSGPSVREKPVNPEHCG